MRLTASRNDLSYTFDLPDTFKGTVNGNSVELPFNSDHFMTICSWDTLVVLDEEEEIHLDLSSWRLEGFRFP